jgi:hypothetical protein
MKEKPNTLVQPNKVRNELLKRIKDYQSNMETKSVPRIEELQDFTDEFNKSLHFLQDLTNKKDNIYKPSKTKKNPKSFEVDIELPDEMKSDNVSAASATSFAPTSVAVPSTSFATSFAPTSVAVPSTSFAPTSVAVPSTSFATSFAATSFAAAPTTSVAVPNALTKYSSLKNGSRPTYRELNNSIINKPMIRIENKENIEESDKHKMFEKIKSNYKSLAGTQAQALAGAANEVAANEVAAANEVTDNDKYVYIPKRKIKKTTRTCKYRLGKLGNKVSVLIKDYKTRKNIQNECYKLEKTSITDIKNFLRKRNLLKVGSVADEGVLREMYENCILAGDVENKNKDTLIHNFLAKV